MNKILIIDDDEDISAMLYLLLKSNGFDVATVTRSEDIFQKIRTFVPETILLDVFLNGYDGRVICKQLKFHPYSKHIPVIMVSADDDALLTVESYGANDFIHKPFETEELIAKIRNQLTKQSA